MIYKQFGKTNKQVSAIGFGGMRLPEDNEYGAEVIRYANEKGINYFDTAPGYCQDRSEDVFGMAFKKMPGPFYVSTKSSIRSEATADEVRARIEKSLRRMNLEKINFYNMWCILDLAQYEAVMAPGGPYEGALKAKEEGLIEHLNFTTHCSGADIAKIIRDEKFEAVTLGYNIINFPFRQEGIAAAGKYDIPVITMNPIGGGIIARNQDYFKFLVQNEKESPMQAALRFNASHKEIKVVLSGMSSKEQVDENCKAVDNLIEFSHEEIDNIKARISQSLNGLCTQCGYCMNCPKNINITGYMELYNKFVIYGEQAMIEERKNWTTKEKYDGFVGQLGTCIACGQCDRACTQKLEIVNRLKELKQRLERL